MSDQYERLNLIIGNEQLNIIKSKKILIFGVGGVGGNVCDALARSGIMHFGLVDNDDVNITNINRQLIANTNTIGKKKIDVMEEHLKSLNPDIEIKKYDLFYLPDNNDIDFSEYDYVIDAIDTVSAKISIVMECQKLNIPVISALGCGNKFNPLDLCVDDIFNTNTDPLARVLRYELRKRGIKKLKVVYSKELPKKLQQQIINENGKLTPGSTAFVPPVCGIIIASEVFKDLLKS